RSVGAAVQDQGRSTRYARRWLPAPLLAGRAAPGAQRPVGRDVARRPAPAADPRLRAAAGVAPQALPRPAGNDRAVAGLRPHRPQLRRPGPAGFLLHRERVDLARYPHPREDAPRRARTARSVLEASNEKLRFSFEVRYGSSR